MPISHKKPDINLQELLFGGIRELVNVVFEVLSLEIDYDLIDFKLPANRILEPIDLGRKFGQQEIELGCCFEHIIHVGKRVELLLQIGSGKYVLPVKFPNKCYLISIGLSEPEVIE